MKVRVSVGGVEVDSSDVLFDAWKFGKAAVPPEPLHSVQLLVEREEFIAWAVPVYDELIRELEADDQLVGLTPAYEGRVDYPSLLELFALPQDSRMSVLGYLRFDILERYLPASERPVRWFGVSIDNISLDEAWLRVDGTVRAAAGPTAPSSSTPWGWFLSLFR